MVYTYGADMEFDGQDGCWYVTFPAFPGEITAGGTVAEAVRMARDLLYLLVAERIDEGLPVPEGGLDEVPRLIVSIDVTDEGIEATKCMTVSEAAERLGVTPGRVSQLLNGGQLEAYMHGNTRLVTIASVNARLANKPASHRPRKAATA